MQCELILFTNYFVEKHQIEYLLKIVWYSVISFLGAFLSKNICNVALFSGILELVWNSIVAVTVSGLCFIVGGIILPEHKSAALFVKKIIRGK
mgnify:FL=1